MLEKDTYLKKINLIKNNFKKLEIITLSANKELGIKELLKYLIKNYKFYANSVCNNNLEVESDFVEDVVREKVLANVHEEIPYNLKFKTDKLTENKDKSYKINLSIIYSKKSHKPIILGKNGKNIRKISMTARQDLERIYKRKFHLFLFLKEIKKNRVKIGNLENKALVLSKVNYSENSLILKVFTDKKGVQTGLVKGGKSLKKVIFMKQGI